MALSRGTLARATQRHRGERIKKLIDKSVWRVDSGSQLVAEAGRTIGEIVEADSPP
jgi:methyl-accepting chemotaxis protein